MPRRPGPDRPHDGAPRGGACQPRHKAPPGRSRLDGEAAADPAGPAPVPQAIVRAVGARQPALGHARCPVPCIGPTRTPSARAGASVGRVRRACKTPIIGVPRKPGADDGAAWSGQTTRYPSVRRLRSAARRGRAPVRQDRRAYARSGPQGIVRARPARAPGPHRVVAAIARLLRVAMSHRPTFVSRHGPSPLLAGARAISRPGTAKAPDGCWPRQAPALRARRARPVQEMAAAWANLPNVWPRAPTPMPRAREVSRWFRCSP